MELYRQANTALNLASEQEVVGWTYAGPGPREIIAKVTAGDAINALSGAGGNYQLRILLNTHQVFPNAYVPVPPTNPVAIFASRVVPIDAGDVVSVRLLGVSTDTNVNVVGSIRDATPATVSDQSGAGFIEVDHNFGGSNALAYRVPSGGGIDYATILAYASTDYNAGNLAKQYVVAESTTLADGTWSRPMLLNPGSYTLVFSKPGAFGPDIRTITVVAP